MGMEGKLRQVSENELNTYRKNPEKLYADVMQRASPPEVQQFIAKMMELQTSPVGEADTEARIRGPCSLSRGLRSIWRAEECADRGEP